MDEETAWAHLDKIAILPMLERRIAETSGEKSKEVQILEELKDIKCVIQGLSAPQSCTTTR